LSVDPWRIEDLWTDLIVPTDATSKTKPSASKWKMPGGAIYNAKRRTVPENSRSQPWVAMNNANVNIPVPSRPGRKRHEAMSKRPPMVGIPKALYERNRLYNPTMERQKQSKVSKKNKWRAWKAGIDWIKGWIFLFKWISYFILKYDYTNQKASYERKLQRHQTDW